MLKLWTFVAPCWITLSCERSQTCHKCKKLNHYARVCRSNNADRQRSTQNQTWPSARQSHRTTKQKIQRVKAENETVSSESSTSEDEYLYACHTNTLSKMPSVKVKLNNVRVQTVNTHRRINQHNWWNNFCLHKQSQTNQVTTSSHQAICIWIKQTIANNRKVWHCCWK
jgi:nitrite reductase/ring-hydroxylating ferredoxin subunit